MDAISKRRRRPAFRRLIALALLGCVASPAFGQAETLFSGDIVHGGFGGPMLRLTAIDDVTALFIGGRGGWILNFSDGHALVLGGGGYGLATNVRAEGLSGNDDEPLYLDMGYGGAIIEYVNRTTRLTHFTVELLVGAGGANYRNRDGGTHGGEDAFFVAEPGLNLMLNVTTFFRIGAGVSYRYVSGTDLEAFSDTDLSGINGVLTFKFGRF